MQSISKILNERDKVLFEKALKFYFFARQTDLKRLPKDLFKRIHYSGTVAYSLIITYAKSGSLKIEYMDFLNQELKQFLSTPKKTFKELQIQPDEIDDIELMEETKFNFYDEDEESDCRIIYNPSLNKISLEYH